MPEGGKEERKTVSYKQAGKTRTGKILPGKLNKMINPI